VSHAENRREPQKKRNTHMGDLQRGPAMTGADLGPEHHGAFVEITTVVTEENDLGEPVTVRGMIHHASRAVQFRTNLRVTTVIMRPTGHGELMTFRIGARTPVRVFTQA
jgi:hypothetical protein